MLSKEFIQVWRNWIRTPCPCDNFYSNRVTYPAYNIELELEHLRSYIAGVTEDAIGKEKADYSNLAVREINELERIELDLESCSISQNQRQMYQDYINLTRSLLEELKKFSLP